MIIEKRGFQRITPEQFRCPVDRFRESDYLPLDEPVTFYALEDHEAGYAEPGWGEGFTIKVNADRNRVIFRRESAGFYRYRYWESRNR